MYGFLLRAAPQALFIALLGAVLSMIIDPFLDVMLDGEASEGDLLIAGLQAISGEYVLIGLTALLVTLIARAVLEARVGV